MLRIILASALLVTFAYAGVLPEAAREKRSPQGGGGTASKSSLTEPFTAWSNKQSTVVAEQSNKNFQQKAAEGVEIQRDGDRTQAVGQSNAIKVEATNTKAVITALNDVDKAHGDASLINGGEPDGNINRNNGGGANRNNGGGNGGNNGGDSGYNGGNNGGLSGYNGGNNGGGNGYNGGNNEGGSGSNGGNNGGGNGN